MSNLKQIAEKLKTEKTAAIFCHVRPDGDAVGSAVALSLALNALGIDTAVFCADVIPARFNYMPSAKTIKSVFSGEYTAYIAVDCADEGRLGDMGFELSKHSNAYNIDHHVSNTKYAKYNAVIDNASNCENIFSLVKELGVEFTPEIATALITGIVTDTGNFKHNNVTAKTLLVASELKEYGADLHAVVYRNFTEQSAERAKLFGLVMSRIRYLLDGKFAVAYVLQSDLEKSNARPDETEGFIDFVMGITGVEVGACIMQMGADKYKISLRSKSADVNAVANKFGGGGHILASGCQMQGEFEEVVDNLRYAVSQYLPN